MYVYIYMYIFIYIPSVTSAPPFPHITPCKEITEYRVVYGTTTLLEYLLVSTTQQPHQS